MGHRKFSAPKRGSLAFLPRGRASRWVGRIRSWPNVDGEPRLLAFAGYKAGMTYAVTTDTRQGSLTYGKEVTVPITFIETPPLIVCAVRAYTRTTSGLKTFSEAWMEKPPPELSRLTTLPEKFKTEESLKKIEGSLDRIAELRAQAIPKPKVAKVDRKKPQLLEIKIGGTSIKQQFDYAKGILGKEVRFNQVFQEGQYVDVIAVTKGKGIQGPVKRWGVSKLFHKSRKTVRGVGSIGPWHPHFVMYSVPRAGQMGFFQRTEYNKQVFKIGEEGAEVTPKGGFTHYGRINGDYVMLKGSVPGPVKRLMTLRYPMRPPAKATPPALQYLHVATQ